MAIDPDVGVACGGPIIAFSEEADMNRRTMLLAVAVSFVGVTAGFAADPNMGTWKLNEAKSKFTPGAPKNRTVVYEAAGDNVKVTVDGVDNKGTPLHSEW